jgi:hypothetical protein
VNGDGFADLIVGAWRGDDGGTYAGEAYVVFGKASGFGTVDGTGRAVIDLTNLSPADGFIVEGDTGYDNAGYSVSSAGDVNGDGFADVVIGAPDACQDFVGRAFVVFGGPGLGGRVDLDQLGTRGFEIRSATDFKAGRTLGAVSDVNADGLADLALGNEDYNPEGRPHAGAVVIVHGQRGTEPIRLSSLGAAGFRWVGPERGSGFGSAVAGLGDFDGDGRPDLLAGAPLLAANAGGAWILSPP